MQAQALQRSQRIRRVSKVSRPSIGASAQVQRTGGAVHDPNDRGRKSSLTILQDMRYSVITASTPQRLTDEKGAGIYVKVPALLSRMEKAGWIKPIVQRPKMKLYDLNALDLCVDRLSVGEWPDY